MSTGTELFERTFVNCRVCGRPWLIRDPAADARARLQVKISEVERGYQPWVGGADFEDGRLQGLRDALACFDAAAEGGVLISSALAACEREAYERAASLVEGIAPKSPCETDSEQWAQGVIKRTLATAATAIRALAELAEKKGGECDPDR